ncbi:efflux RND transporter periplasmic adaptor subunit [Candidatus Poribacteria bacterium]|nr:efflux RND transporter periplasmic adaptor subunit [Candidatus Poribacteria bacterium]
MNKIIFLFSTLIYISFFLISCGKTSGPETSSKLKHAPPTQILEESAVLVKSTIVKRIAIEELLNVTGNIEAWDEVKVSSKIQGRVTKVYFDEGDYIKKGDVLFQLEDEEINIQIKQSEMAIKSTEVLIDKAKLSLKVLDDKISVMIKQAQAGVEVQEASLSKVNAGSRIQEKEQARLGVQQAEITLDNAKTNFERSEKLYKSEAMTKPQYEAAKLQFELAKSRLKVSQEIFNLMEAGSRDEDKVLVGAQVHAAHASLELAEAQKQDKKVIEEDVKTLEIHLNQAKLSQELIKITLDNTKIVSPMSGIIIKKSVNNGEMVSPGIPVFFISQIDPLKVKAEIPENELSKIKTGLIANIKIDAYKDTIFSGNIIYISPILNQTSRTCTIEIKIPNTDKKIKSGMFARIVINIGKKDNALVVPKDVLIFDEDKYHLFQIQNNIAILKDVKPGLSQDDKNEILDGINEGDEIVSMGKEYVKNGMKIKVTEQE